MTDELSEEDKALFLQHMRSVKPLKNSSKKCAEPPSPIKVVVRKDKFAEPLSKIYFLSDSITQEVNSESVISYKQTNFSSARFKDLRKGKIPWQSKLDLHGMPSERARNALCEFISNQLREKVRCILIVHGKGGHDGAPPVIKNLVNRWLPQFDTILAFHSALPRDGGTGAIYVFLKKPPFL